jgi:hypothetical protein
MDAKKVKDLLEDAEFSRSLESLIEKTGTQPETVQKAQYDYLSSIANYDQVKNEREANQAKEKKKYFKSKVKEIDLMKKQSSRATPFTESTKQESDIMQRLRKALRDIKEKKEEFDQMRDPLAIVKENNGEMTPIVDDTLIPLSKGGVTVIKFGTDDHSDKEQLEPKITAPDPVKDPEFDGPAASPEAATTVTKIEITSEKEGDDMANDPKVVFEQSMAEMFKILKEESPEETAEVGVVPAVDSPDADVQPEAAAAPATEQPVEVDVATAEPEVMVTDNSIRIEIPVSSGEQAVTEISPEASDALKEALRVVYEILGSTKLNENEDGTVEVPADAEADVKVEGDKLVVEIPVDRPIEEINSEDSGALKEALLVISSILKEEAGEESAVPSVEDTDTQVVPEGAETVEVDAETAQPEMMVSSDSIRIEIPLAGAELKEVGESEMEKISESLAAIAEIFGTRSLREDETVEVDVANSEATVEVEGDKLVIEIPAEPKSEEITEEQADKIYESLEVVLENVLNEKRVGWKRRLQRAAKGFGIGATTGATGGAVFGLPGALFGGLGGGITGAIGGLLYKDDDDRIDARAAKFAKDRDSARKQVRTNAQKELDILVSDRQNARKAALQGYSTKVAPIFRKERDGWAEMAELIKKAGVKGEAGEAARTELLARIIADKNASAIANARANPDTAKLGDAANYLDFDDTGKVSLEKKFLEDEAKKKAANPSYVPRNFKDYMASLSTEAADELSRISDKNRNDILLIKGDDVQRKNYIDEMYKRNQERLKKIRSGEDYDGKDAGYDAATKEYRDQLARIEAAEKKDIEDRKDAIAARDLVLDRELDDSSDDARAEAEIKKKKKVSLIDWVNFDFSVAEAIIGDSEHDLSIRESMISEIYSAVVRGRILRSLNESGLAANERGLRRLLEENGITLKEEEIGGLLDTVKPEQVSKEFDKSNKGERSQEIENVKVDNSKRALDGDSKSEDLVAPIIESSGPAEPSDSADQQYDVEAAIEVDMNVAKKEEEHEIKKDGLENKAEPSDVTVKDDIKPGEEAEYRSLKEAFLLEEGYFDKDSISRVTAAQKQEKLENQIGLLIARESADPLYEELLHTTAIAKQLQLQLQEKYKPVAKKKAKQLIDTKKSKEKKPEVAQASSSDSFRLVELLNRVGSGTASGLNEGIIDWVKGKLLMMIVGMLPENVLDRLIMKAHTKALSMVKSAEERKAVEEEFSRYLKDKRDKVSFLKSIMNKAPEKDKQIADQKMKAIAGQVSSKIKQQEKQGIPVNASYEQIAREMDESLLEVGGLERTFTMVADGGGGSGVVTAAAEAAAPGFLSLIGNAIVGFLSSSLGSAVIGVLGGLVLAGVSALVYGIIKKVKNMVEDPYGDFRGA